ncbi:YjfB family protein [Clostridium thailandense]|uniref:YjfB family protein n=1 Tax=Clostridium thailandense TaxID=2794346 RepID=A0A949X1J9_9CLOT|nr:YjfB family protein [Clostridium thailandense]MBV7272239.1 YjfB family protein [Clostridium thailandense]MCH5137785.1 YjfB family protein [Clostridiaceae bacterium UIB06]
MDIPELSVVMSQANAMQQAGISLTKMAMDTNKENAQNMKDMIEKSALPNLGNNIDSRA